MIGRCRKGGEVGKKQHNGLRLMLHGHRRPFWGVVLKFVVQRLLFSCCVVVKPPASMLLRKQRHIRLSSSAGLLLSMFNKWRQTVYVCRNTDRPTSTSMIPPNREGTWATFYYWVMLLFIHHWWCSLVGSISSPTILFLFLPLTLCQNHLHPHPPFFLSPLSFCFPVAHLWMVYMGDWLKQIRLYSPPFCMLQYLS